MSTIPHSNSHLAPIPRRHGPGSRATALLAIALLAICATAPADAPVFPEAAYRKHVEVLASDEFEGRAIRDRSRK